MALTLMQKLRVVFRGWSRRRADEARRRDEEFLRKNMSWGNAPGAPAQYGTRPQALPDGATQEFDIEGLQVAYLDDSGKISYFLDIETGDVIDVRDGTPRPAPRYCRVPARNASSDLDDRRAFIETLDASAMRDSLKSNVGTNEFRRVLSADRTIERAWYNFRNQRATKTIESWLRDLKLRRGRPA